MGRTYSRATKKQVIFVGPSFIFFFFNRSLEFLLEKLHLTPRNCHRFCNYFNKLQKLSILRINFFNFTNSLGFFTKSC
jgi:hypothetical protein